MCACPDGVSLSNSGLSDSGIRHNANRAQADQKEREPELLDIPIFL
ncbi:MAG: hypothetical protein ACK412_03150 [Chloroherpetonaceae bacterium]